MTKQRATFGKLQRERDKQDKARAKRERRQAAAEQAERTDDDRGRTSTESAPVLIDLIAELHRKYENHEISLETFEERKADLLSRLPID